MKLSISILMSVFLFFSCLSCGKTVANEPTFSPTADATYREVYNPDTDFDNRFGRTNPGMAETEDAYYFISTLGNYIYYYDKLSAERGVLCGKPECMHDSSETNVDCMGWVHASGTGHVNYYDGKLYYTGYSNYGDSQIHESLYRMDPDGSNRERLFPFTCTNQYFPSGGTALHRGKLYGWGDHPIVDSAEAKRNVNLSCWDLETGESKLIYERTDSVSNSKLRVFFFGSYVYLCDAFFYPNNSERGCTVIILRWDIVKEQLETVFMGEGFGGSYYDIWVEAENKIYIAPIFSENFEKTNVYCLSNGEVSIAVSVEGAYCPRLIEGAFAFLALSNNIEEQHVIITDYEGNVLYEGGWSFDALNELPGEPNWGSFAAVYGDRDTIYIIYYVNDNRIASGMRQCIVRYDIQDGEIVDSKLLCVSKW